MCNNNNTNARFQLMTSLKKSTIYLLKTLLSTSFRNDENWLLVIT